MCFCWTSVERVWELGGAMARASRRLFGKFMSLEIGG
jgi:hypothetical protein